MSVSRRPLLMRWLARSFIVFQSLLWGVVFCQSAHPECGPPTNLTLYPKFAQEEIRAVWKNYIPGTKCDQELLITEDIFAVLDSFNKEIEKDMATIESPPVDQPVLENSSNLKLNQDIEAMQSVTPPTTTTTPSTTSATATKSFGDVDSKFATISSTTEADYLDFIFPGNPTPEHFVPVTTTKASVITTVHNLVESPRPISGDTSDYDYFDKKEPSFSGRTLRPIKKPTQVFPTVVDNPNQSNGRFSQIKETNHEDKVPPGMLLSEMRLKLPFLQNVGLNVIRRFQQVFNDPNIPSESLRDEEVHLLAVSYLNASQLKSFNEWSARRRKHFHLHLHDQPLLSNRARVELEALKKLPETERREHALELPPKIRNELKRYAIYRRAISS